MAGRTKSKTQAAEPDEAERRQPAWREPPAKPRRRARRNSFAVQSAGNSRNSRGGAPARPFIVPPREVLLGWLRVAVALVVTAGLAVGLVYLLRWPALTAGPGTTLIGGAQRIDPAVIYEKSEIGGRSILVLRSDEVETRLLAVPGVAKASVHLRLPNQVIIDVTEHAPLVAWQAVTSTIWLAADGSEVPQSGGLPPLQLVDQSGGKLLATPRLRALILANLNALRSAGPEIDEMYYGNTQGLYYRASEGWEVWLGESGDMQEKLALASATGRNLAQAGRQPKVVDVRHSNRKAMWW